MREPLDAAGIELSAAELARIAEALPRDLVAGDRYASMALING